MNTNEIVSLIDQTLNSNVFKSDNKRSGDLKQLKERLSDNVFRVAVVGEFSTGKSTFINSLIGADVLAHATNETTAAITYIYNVNSSDKRVNTCEIEYNDGRKVCVKNLSEIEKYTTTQKGSEVAETIKCVSIFVCFLDTDSPIVIVDTPGLNGVADKHRDITISEIKKAHSCVYLLSLKGLTDSDSNFLSILTNYQSQFIFVQNFIDELKSSEGESIEKKLEKDKELILDIMPKENIKFEICGISALKALCSKDKTIKKLYSNDVAELTDDDRKRLAEESHLVDFERILSDIMSSGRYKQIIADAAVQTLYSSIESVLPGLEKRQQLNEQIQKEDNKTKRINKARAVIDSINKTTDDKKRRLKDFIVYQDKENRTELKKYLKNQLEAVIEKINSSIDQRIQSYDEYSSFESIENKSVSEYYSVMTERIINAEVIPGLNKLAEEFLQHLYEMGEQRVIEYSDTMVQHKASYTVDVDSLSAKLESSDTSTLAEISRDSERMEAKKRELEKTSAQIVRNNEALQQINQNLSSAISEKQTENKRIQGKISSLGRKPDVEKKEERRTRTVERSGFFGKILDFFHTKTETYYVTITDDSAQREWMRKYNEFAQQQDNINSRYNNKILQYESEKDSKMSMLRSNQAKKDFLEREIAELDKQIRRETYIYEQGMKKRKNEFFLSQISKLKASIEKSMFDNSGDECVLEKLSYHIDAVSESNRPNILRIILQHYDENINEQIKLLNEIINDNTEKIKEQYHSDEAEITVLTEIRNILINSMEESNYEPV